MAEHKDCFGYKVSGYCTALTKMVCIKGDCSFYKTRKQFKADEEKARVKLERKKNEVAYE